MSKYKLKIVNNNNCNNGGIYDLAPFKTDNNIIIIKSDFFNTERWFYDELIKKGYTVLIDDNFNKILTRDDKWWEIYYLYISYFFSDHYNHVLNYDNTIIKLSKLHKEHIKNNNLNSSEMNKLYNEIELSLIKYNNSFVKTTGFTPKKVNNIIPFDMNSKGIDVIKYLFENTNDRCMKFIDYSNIIIQPWNNDISLDRELRIFIKDKLIVAISQQDSSKQYVFFSFIKEYYETICNNCDKLWESIKDKLFYTNCILDVYIDDNFDIHLIEINPTHSWTGAGSALFEWIKDYPCNNEFRLL